MREESAPPDAVVAGIAARQHGVVLFGQLVAAGVTKNAIGERVRRGHLHRVHRGVYAVGHVGLSIEGRWMAAVLACGPGAALSHMSAAALWGLLRPEPGPIDISLPSHSGRRRRTGVRIHRCASLAAPPSLTEDGREGATTVTIRRGIPVTTPARTIHDLRAAAPTHLVRRAIRQAQLAGHALDAGVPSDRTRSDLERDFLRLCRRHGLPRPEVNVRVGRWTVDFLWRRQRLAVETDSLRFHRGEVAFEDDHARDLDLRAAGFAIHRFSERQIEAEPERVAADLALALGA